jgi:hypothetical protein
MRSVVEQILGIEGPIHESEVARRVTSLYGKTRSGERIQSHVLSALRAAQRKGVARCEDEFWSAAGAPLRPEPRLRSPDLPPGLRKAEYLAPREIEAAVLALVETHAGMTEEDLGAAAPRFFGFDRSGASLRTAVSAAVQRLIADALVVKSGALIVAVRAAA